MTEPKEPDGVPPVMDVRRYMELCSFHFRAHLHQKWVRKIKNRNLPPLSKTPAEITPKFYTHD